MWNVRICNQAINLSINQPIIEHMLTVYDNIQTTENLWLKAELLLKLYSAIRLSSRKCV